MSVPTQITVPVSFEMRSRIDTVVENHPIMTRAAVARYAMEIGLAEVERLYPKPRQSQSKKDSRPPEPTVTPK